MKQERLAGAAKLANSQAIKSWMSLLGGNSIQLNKGKIDEAINALKDQDLIYYGTLEQPKGKVIEDWEPREQMFFKSLSLINIS